MRNFSSSSNYEQKRESLRGGQQHAQRKEKLNEALIFKTFIF